MGKIGELAQLFAKYKIYPKSCYNDHSPVRVFQRMFPENHYSKDLETLLFYQNYKSIRRGADLAWWGKKFFTKQTRKHPRILIVGQDSLFEDAGSITLASQFFPDISFNLYQEFINKMGGTRYFGFSKWGKVKNQLIKWGIDFNFLYITDARKVYKEESRNSFDEEKSKELLEAEIEFCNPDLIILLGASPLYLLDENKNYASIVEGGEPIMIKGKKCVVAPFFIGNGLAQPNFKRRLEIATNLIKAEVI